MVGMQKTFLEYVEETTERLGECITIRQPGAIKIHGQEEPGQEEQQQDQWAFPPKPDMQMAQEVANKLSRIWERIDYKANFEQFLDLILAALERREADYMALVKSLDKGVLDTYVEMYSLLYEYFISGYYGDPLGSFYMQSLSHGNNGEYYTPWGVAYMMAQMVEPKPGDIICDPCCGSGIMLLAARCIIHKKHGWIASSGYGRNIYGMDISSRAVKMAKINLYLTDYVYMICLMQQAVTDARDYMQQAKITEAIACQEAS